MATVKLTSARVRGDEEYVAGDTYECSDGEAAALLEQGNATKVHEAKAPKIEAAAVADAPETATKSKPTRR